MQYSISILQRRFTHVSCVQYVMNLAYKSVAEVVLRSLPNTQAASRTQNANVSNKALIFDTQTGSVPATCSLYAFLFLNILQNLPDLKCTSQLQGSCPIYAEYIGIPPCSQPRQQVGWLHGWLTFNVNARLIFRAKALGLSHDNGRFGHTTSVITLSAKRDVMIVKLLVCAVYWTVKQAVLPTGSPVTKAYTITHIRETEAHTLTSLLDIHT